MSFIEEDNRLFEAMKKNIDYAEKIAANVNGTNNLFARAILLVQMKKIVEEYMMSTMEAGIAKKLDVDRIFTDAALFVDDVFDVHTMIISDDPMKER